MPANHRRYAQAFPLAYVCVGIAVLVCIVSFAVKTLMLSQQLRQGGERLRRLKNETAELSIKIEGLQTKKTQLTSTPALLKAIKDGTVKLVPIEPRFIVEVGAVHRGVAAAVAQPAAGGGR